ncbi:uncharacterized protein PSFLO_07193 [Pseudozyma flocculosa]|uniref:Uncharacterized protein n=1 Tax=Pseudozyma flocculosa TaxID=84751 RepID=A0A5C3FE10_9BASI|nr:uncharacterized protein PSFLO_07193 [Pseudozyma flocculosa]
MSGATDKSHLQPSTSSEIALGKPLPVSASERLTRLLVGATPQDADAELQAHEHPSARRGRPRALSAWDYGNADVFERVKYEILERLQAYMKQGSDMTAAVGRLIDFAPTYAEPEDPRELRRIYDLPKHALSDINRAILFKDIDTPSHRVYFRENKKRSNDLSTDARKVSVFSAVALPWPRDSSQRVTFLGEIVVLRRLAFTRKNLPKRPFAVSKISTGPLFGRAPLARS